MKRKIVIVFLLFLLGGFTSCEKEINDKLIGNWVAEETKDTLAFLSTYEVHFNPYQNSSLEHWCGNYYLYESMYSKENMISFCRRGVIFSSNFCPSYPFKYSKKQIEVGQIIYKRIK